MSGSVYFLTTLNSTVLTPIGLMSLDCYKCLSVAIYPPLVKFLLSAANLNFRRKNTKIPFEICIYICTYVNSYIHRNIFVKFRFSEVNLNISRKATKIPFWVCIYICTYVNRYIHRNIFVKFRLSETNLNFRRKYPLIRYVYTCAYVICK